MDIYELLDEDRDASVHQHARALVASDRKLISDLVAFRKKSGLSQGQVAGLMGTSQASVSRFESGSSDVHLSSIRRYAHAIGAVVEHAVRPFNAPQTHGLDAWEWDEISPAVVKAGLK